MKTQAELLQGTNIPTDDLQGISFTPDQQEFLKVVESFAFAEWSRVADCLGLTATTDHVPENYEGRLRQSGRWDKDYPTKEQLG